MPRHPSYRCRTIVLSIALAVLTIITSASSFGADGREILWDIVSNCIDTSVADYCTRCSEPREEIDCRSCWNTTQVWAESKDLVVIRDRKMCGCPEGFVHGLAIPRSRVTGVEDPDRPDGIWEFAWAAAARRLPENEIALAVNPRWKRSQDQLHVHIVRLRSGSLPADSRQIARVDTLRKVWQAAAGIAAKIGLQDYGVLVARGLTGGYLVLIDDGSPEYKFTRAECR